MLVIEYVYLATIFKKNVKSSKLATTINRFASKSMMSSRLNVQFLHCYHNVRARSLRFK